MRTMRWIISGLLVIVAIIGIYVWSIQPVASASPPLGWQTFKQGKLSVVLPPEFIVLDPNQPSVNQKFTKIYSGTLESLEKISSSSVKIEFLAVNLENGDMLMLIDKANHKNESAVLEQIDNVAELLFHIRNHNKMNTESFSRTGAISISKNIVFYAISEKSQYTQSYDAFQLIRLQIKLENN